MLRDFLARARCSTIAVVAIAAVGSASLSACGVKGPLKLPPAPATAPGSTTAPAQGSQGAPAQTSPAEPEPQPPATRP